MRVCVGRIRKPQGIRGAVIIEPYTLSPLFFLEKNRIFYTKTEMEVSLLDPKIVKNCLLSKLVGCFDRASVEKFNNEELYVERSSLPAAGDDEYYFEDLKGLKIVDADRKDFMGEVTNVCDHGAGVFLEIKTTYGKIATIPFNRQSILVVDLDNSEIIVNVNMVLI